MKEQRREVVEIGEELRRKTEGGAAAVHRLLADGRTPPPVYTKRCESCSLVNICLPRGVGGGKNRVARYLARILADTECR
jgi:CRISPR-associated exonuclease Cas4